MSIIKLFTTKSEVSALTAGVIIKFSVKGTSYASVLIGADFFGGSGVWCWAVPRRATPPSDGLKFSRLHKISGNFD